MKIDFSNKCIGIGFPNAPAVKLLPVIN